METAAQQKDAFVETSKGSTNRRPLQHINVNSTTTSSSQSQPKSTNKPKQSSLTTLLETKEKLSVFSENVTEWSPVVDDKEQPEHSSALPQDPTTDSDKSYMPRPPIFRQQMSLSHMEDMLVLKRANPVYDSDDEEDFMESPTKRQRTSSEPQTLSWGECLSEDEDDGFVLSSLYSQ